MIQLLGHYSLSGLTVCSSVRTEAVTQNGVTPYMRARDKWSRVSNCLTESDRMRCNPLQRISPVTTTAVA